MINCYTCDDLATRTFMYDCHSFVVKYATYSAYIDVRLAVEDLMNEMHSVDEWNSQCASTPNMVRLFFLLKAMTLGPRSALTISRESTLA